MMCRLHFCLLDWPKIEPAQLVWIRMEVILRVGDYSEGVVNLYVCYLFVWFVYLLWNIGSLEGGNFMLGMLG